MREGALPTGRDRVHLIRISYSFTDTPQTAGTYTYLARWTGNTTAGAAKALKLITVTPGTG